MEHISVADFVVPILLAGIAFFLHRLIKQQDQAHKATQLQFSSLLDKIDVLTKTLTDHKTDVAVLAERVGGHTKSINDINKLYDRIRDAENNIAGIKGDKAKG